MKAVVTAGPMEFTSRCDVATVVEDVRSSGGDVAVEPCSVCGQKLGLFEDGRRVGRERCDGLAHG